MSRVVSMDSKVVVFDMDGTVADLYAVSGWLECLEREDVRPYVEAQPLYNMAELRDVLLSLKDNGWRVVVTSWLSKGSSKSYDKEVRRAKREWLEKYQFPFDDIHLVKYGTTKANCTRALGGYQVLVDDNEAVRRGWGLGATINANNNIMTELLSLLKI